MKNDERASAELLEVIELAKQFLEQQKRQGLQHIMLRRDTWGRLEEAVQKTHLAAEAKDARKAVEEIGNLIGGCTKCHLSRNRKNVVPGEGNPNAKLMFIGEAPGADEDAQGRPFVGRAGQLLTRIIEAIKLERSDVFICNILKCRPPQNRTPSSEEIELCIPYLLKQLEAINPKIICALGNVAAQTLLRTKSPMNRLRGKFHRFGNAILMPTYHPAALLRNPAYKKDVWEDVQMIQREYEKLSLPPRFEKG